MPFQLRVATAHDSALVRSLLRGALHRRHVGVVAEAGRLEDLLLLCRSERPDVVLCEATVGGESVSSVVPALVRLGISILVVTEEVSPEAVRLLRTGVSGLLSSEISIEELYAALVAVRRGGAPLDPKAAAAVVSEWRTHDQRKLVSCLLSARESDVLEGLSHGLTTKAIARRHGLAVKTIESHKTRLFAKLGVRTQAEAVALAISGGLTEDTVPLQGLDP